jgi:pSer/pThr/pTyr-binding forkhead associated (FHA) protein
LSVSVNLFCKENHFGRNVESCDFAYKAREYQIKKDVYVQISQRHFTIHEYDNGAYLVDHSRHGTFVNGLLVGRAESNGERRILLENGDKISVVTADGPCKCIFVVL